MEKQNTVRNLTRALQENEYCEFLDDLPAYERRVVFNFDIQSTQRVELNESIEVNRTRDYVIVYDSPNVLSIREVAGDDYFDFCDYSNSLATFDFQIDPQNLANDIVDFFDSKIISLSD
jgi:hypothetical protein